MSQHDLDIANASGSAVRSDLNLALKALGSTSKGSSAPGTLQTGQLWIDDSGTPWILKVYDGAQHITVGTVNASTNAFSLAVAEGGTGAATATAGFDALSPMTASGDVIYGGSSGTVTRLAKGSDDEVLTLASGVPTWAAAGGGSAKLTVEFESGTTSITADSVHTIAHSLGVRPTAVFVWIKCNSADKNWAVGDYVMTVDDPSSIDAGWLVQADATNIEIVMGSGIRIKDQSTKNDLDATVSKWDFVVTAYGGSLG